MKKYIYICKLAKCPKYLYALRDLAQIVEGIINLLLLPFNRQVDFFTLHFCGKILRHGQKLIKDRRKVEGNATMHHTQ